MAKRTEGKQSSTRKSSATKRTKQTKRATAAKKKTAKARKTVRQQAADRRAAKAAEEQLRWQIYKSIPKKHYLEMSGRQAKTVNEQADRYGLPIRARTISLPDLLHAIHDFLAEHGPKLGPGAVGELSPMDRKRAADAELREMELAAQRRELIPRQEVRAFHGVLAALLRQLGEGLMQDYGPDAGNAVNEMLGRIERSSLEKFGNGHVTHATED